MAVEDVAAANGLGIDDTLSIGQQVAIPQAAPQTAAPTDEGATAPLSPCPRHTAEPHHRLWRYAQLGGAAYDVFGGRDRRCQRHYARHGALFGQCWSSRARQPGRAYAAPTEAPSPEATPAPERVVHWWAPAIPWGACRPV